MENKLKTKIIKPMLNGINKFYNSDWFIAFFSLAVLTSWVLECEYIAVITAVVTLIYMFLTQEHLDRMAVIAIVIPAMVDANMRHRINFGQIYILIGLLLLVVASAVYHFVKLRKPNNRKIIKSHFFIVYVATVLVLCTSGLGYPGNTIGKVLIPVGVHIALLGLYCLLYKFGGPNLKDSIIKAIIALAGIIVVEMVIFFMRQEDILYTITIKTMSLGWAITNSVAVILALAVPLCFYLARGKKVQLPYMLLGTVLYAFVFLTNCRSMMLVGTAVYLITILLSFIFLNRWQALIHLGVFVLAAWVTLDHFFNSIFSQFLSLGLGDNGRMELWTYYLGEFKTNPIFGMGFYTDTMYQADGMVRAHNTLIQIIASMGVLGMINAIPYYFQRYSAFVIKPTVFKLFAFVAYLAMVGYGLVDCAIISSYKLIITYMLLLAVEFDTLEYTPEPISSIAWAKGIFKRKNFAVSTGGDALKTEQ